MTVIRHYKMEDLQEVVELIEDLGYPTTLSKMENRMKHISQLPLYTTFVAEENGSVVGMIGLREVYTYEHSSPVVQISLLVTSNSVRGKGIGKKLIQHAEVFAKARGSLFIFLTSGTKPERKVAHAFYKKEGFEINGYRFTKVLD